VEEVRGLETRSVPVSWQERQTLSHRAKSLKREECMVSWHKPSSLFGGATVVTFVSSGLSSTDESPQHPEKEKKMTKSGVRNKWRL
jgi:hypothetical protein